MGSKGDKASSQGQTAATATLQALQPMEAVTSRSMFGGHGLFFEDTMFAIVDSEGRLYLRADETTVAPFEAAGAAKHPRMPYWEVPAAVRDEPDELLTWATKAADVALNARR
jgi:DNA transformation protein